MDVRTALMPAFLLVGMLSDPLEAEPREAAAGVLDGRTFVSTIVVDAYDTPFPDRMVFRNGTFLSEECQRRCDFGAQAYYTRTEGDGVAFVVDMVCPDAPQSVRWEGRVVGDRIEGTALWKVERFYWTVERRATFSGTLVAASHGRAHDEPEERQPDRAVIPSQ